MSVPYWRFWKIILRQTYTKYNDAKTMNPKKTLAGEAESNELTGCAMSLMFLWNAREGPCQQQSSSFFLLWDCCTGLRMASGLLWQTVLTFWTLQWFARCHWYTIYWHCSDASVCVVHSSCSAARLISSPKRRLIVPRICDLWTCSIKVSRIS